MTGDQYGEQLDALLPQGLAWPRENDARMRALIRGLAEEFARVDALGNDLLREVLPSTTIEMLSDWERVAGLPDNCVIGTITVGPGTHPITAPEITSFSRASPGTYFDSVGALRIAADDVPRFDHDPITGALKGLLIEGEGENFALWSEDAGNPFWSSLGVTVGLGAALAPDGTMSAYRLTETTATEQRVQFRNNLSVRPGRKFTLSWRVRPDASRTGISVYPSFAGNGIIARFDLSSVAVAVTNVGTGTGYAGIIPLRDGWFVIYATVIFQEEQTNVNARYYFSSVPTNGNATYVGDGVSGIFAWGAQLEPGDLSSYMRTESSAAQRAADQCEINQEQTLQERRGALLSRLGGTGGQSREFFIALAAYLGFTITITEFRPFRVSISHAGDALYDDSWRHVWRVNGPDTTVFEFRAGLSAVGEPLRKWGNELLECVMNRIKPAHTVLLFGYGD